MKEVPTSSPTSPQPPYQIGRLRRLAQRRELAALNKLLGSEEKVHFAQTAYRFDWGRRFKPGRALLAVTDLRVVIVNEKHSESLDLVDILDVEIKNGEGRLDFQTLQIFPRHGQELQASLDVSQKEGDEIIRLVSPSDPGVAMAEPQAST